MAGPGFQEILHAIIAAGASYAALLHQNGVSITEASALAMQPHKRDELAILATALIAAAQALARSCGSAATSGIRQQFTDGGLLLHPITEEHWLFVVADTAASLSHAEALLPAHKPALASLLLDQSPSAEARFMDDIEFADLSDLRFD